MCGVVLGEIYRINRGLFIDFIAEPLPVPFLRRLQRLLTALISGRELPIS